LVVVAARGGQHVVHAVAGMHGQAELFEVILALRHVSRLAHLLDGRQEQANEDGDDGNHHQELDQREADPPPLPLQERHGGSFRQKEGESGTPEAETSLVKIILGNATRWK